MSGQASLAISTPAPILPAWFGATTVATIPTGVTYRSYDGAVGAPPYMVAARAFCPPRLLAHFGALAATDPLPYRLVDAYPNFTAASVDFAWLSMSEYTSNSLDWCVIQAAINWAVGHSNATVHLDHGAYGIIGTLTVPNGIHVIGQGSQGSTVNSGTALLHFDTGTLWSFSGAGTPFLGTGGGLKNMTLVKAQRLAFGGVGYKGGDCIRIVAQDATQRPGEMVFDNILAFNEYTSASLWGRGFVADGRNVRTPGGAGVRSINLRKVRMAGCMEPISNFVFDTVEHVSGHHVECDQGSGSPAGIKVIGDCNDWALNVLCNGTLLIDDMDDRLANVTNVTNANPMVVTLETPHGIPAGETFAALLASVGGCTNANGLWDGTTSGIVCTADATDPKKFSISRAGNAGYTSGGTMQIKPASISNVTNANPMVVTTRTPHRQGLVGQTTNVLIEGVLGCTAANAHWFYVGPNAPATIVSSTTLSLPMAGNGAYVSGGTVRPESPKDVNFMGRLGTLVCRSKHAQGNVIGSTGYVPFVAPTQSSFTNVSKKLRCQGPWTPHFTMHRTTDAPNLTGNNSGFVYIPFESVVRDDNLDDGGGTSNPILGWVATCAGTYEVKPRVTMSNLTPANTRADLKIQLVPAVGLTQDFTAIGNPGAGAAAGYFTMEINELIEMDAGDVLRFELNVTGGAGNTVGVFGDASGYTQASIRLV